MKTPAAPRRFALIGEALTPNGRRQAVVVVKDGKIERVEDPRTIDPKVLPRTQRRPGGLIAPGFIDQQINGFDGVDVMTDRDAPTKLKGSLVRTGVTGFAPTFITAPAEVHRDAFERIADAKGVQGAEVVSVFFEGPYIGNPGAHNPAYIRPEVTQEDLAHLEGLVARGRKAKLPVTIGLASELPGALEAIARLSHHGAVVSLAHSRATRAQAALAVEAGATMGTHLFNAMSGNFKGREPLPPDIEDKLTATDSGVVGVVLTDARVKVGVIADGVHVGDEALQLAFDEKGKDGMFLVTDAMALAGRPAGSRGFLGDRPVTVQDFAVRLEGTDTLAGSAATMPHVIRTMAERTTASLDDALYMASTAVANALGLAHKGRIAAGADADFVVLSNDGKVDVLETIVGGQSVFQRDE